MSHCYCNSNVIHLALAYLFLPVSHRCFLRQKCLQNRMQAIEYSRQYATCKYLITQIILFGLIQLSRCITSLRANLRLTHLCVPDPELHNYMAFSAHQFSYDHNLCHVGGMFAKHSIHQTSRSCDNYNKRTIEVKKPIGRKNKTSYINWIRFAIDVRVPLTSRHRAYQNCWNFLVCPCKVSSHQASPAFFCVDLIFLMSTYICN